MTKILLDATEEEINMIEALKKHFNTTTRTKVLKGSLRMTYDNLKNLNVIK